MRCRGTASIAALMLAAVVGAAALQMAVSARAREQRSMDRLRETQALARIFARISAKQTQLSGDGPTAQSDVTDHAGDSSLRVRVTWTKTGGRWRAASWCEAQTWPVK